MYLLTNNDQYKQRCDNGRSAEEHYPQPMSNDV